jgi:AAA ATPase domain
MYISRFQIGNYKSFRETQPLELSPGFNIVSGQNNSGKTALLEALGLNFIGKPHRSIVTVPVRDSIPNQVSWIDISFVLPGSELRELVLSGLNTIQLVKPDLGSPFARSIGFVDDSQQSAQRLVTAVFSQKELTFRLRKQVPQIGGPSWKVNDVPSYGVYPAQKSGATLNYFIVTLDHSGNVTNVQNQSTPQVVDFGVPLGDFFSRHIYRFLAERMKVGQRAHGASRALLPDAANLPEVLNLTSGQSKSFSRIQ